MDDYIAALEPLEISRAFKQEVEALGGKTFEDRKEAMMWAMAEMYPEDYDGLIPISPGTFISMAFNHHQVEDLYLPPTLH